MPLTKLVQKAKHGTKLGVGQLHSWDSYCQKEKIGEARYMASFDHFLAGLALACCTTDSFDHSDSAERVSSCRSGIVKLCMN